MTLQRLRALGGRYRISLRVALLVALALAVYLPLMFSAERDAAQRLERLPSGTAVPLDQCSHPGAYACRVLRRTTPCTPCRTPASRFSGRTPATSRSTRSPRANRCTTCASKASPKASASLTAVGDR